MYYTSVWKKWWFEKPTNRLFGHVRVKAYICSVLSRVLLDVFCIHAVQLFLIFSQHFYQKVCVPLPHRLISSYQLSLSIRKKKTCPSCHAFTECRLFRRVISNMPRTSRYLICIVTWQQQFTNQMIDFHSEHFRNDFRLRM